MFGGCIVVDLDLLLGLSMVRRCSLNWSFNRRFVSPMYFKKSFIFIRDISIIIFIVIFYYRIRALKILSLLNF